MSVWSLVILSVSVWDIVIVSLCCVVVFSVSSLKTGEWGGGGGGE